MPVNQPPITGDPVLDSFNREIADAINTMQVGATINNTTVVGGGVVLQPIGVVNGVNTAFLKIYQRVAINEVNALEAPDPIVTDLRYVYSTATLQSADTDGHFTIAAPWDADTANGVQGWTPFIPERDPLIKNDWIYSQSIVVAERDDFENIGAAQWGPVQLEVTPGIGALRILTSYEEVVNPDQIDFVATVNKIFLGELEVTEQIPDNQICWLLANDDGSIPIDGISEAEFINRFENGSDEDTTPEPLSDDQILFFNRNFHIPNGEANYQIRHAGPTAMFTQAELFTSTNVDPDAGGDFAQISREIEPRIFINNVVYI